MIVFLWGVRIRGREDKDGVCDDLECLASLVAQMVKNLLAMQAIWVQPLGQEDPLEKEMATHSSILAWRIPRTEEPGGLQSSGSQSQTWRSN